MDGVSRVICGITIALNLHPDLGHMAGQCKEIQVESGSTNRGCLTRRQTDCDSGIVVVTSTHCSGVLLEISGYISIDLPHSSS